MRNRIHLFTIVGGRNVIPVDWIFRASRRIRHNRTPSAACLRAAYLPRRRLYLDARILGLGW